MSRQQAKSGGRVRYSGVSHNSGCQRRKRQAERQRLAGLASSSTDEEEVEETND